MKNKPVPFVEAGRIMLTRINRDFGSTAEYGNNGIFILSDDAGTKFITIVSDELRWEHVSVSLRDHSRLPTWDEMCWIKDLFWDDEELVVQYHPQKSRYINNSPYVLHLWKPKNSLIPQPPEEMIGVQGMEFDY